MTTRAKPQFLLSKSTAVSLGLTLAIAQGLAQYAVTEFRVGQVERELGQYERDAKTRLDAAEAAIVAVRLEYSTHGAKVDEQISHVVETLARIEGRLSGGQTSSAKGRVP